MKHTLQISVSKKPKNDGIAAVRKVSVREKFLRFLFGDKTRLTVIVPGDTVQELEIREIGKGHTKTRLCLSSDSADERSGRRTFSETIRSLHSADETPDRRIFPGTDCLPMKMQQRLTCRAKA